MTKPAAAHFRLRPAHEQSVDEKTWRAAYSRAHAFLIILLHLSLELFGRNAGIKLLCVQLELRRLSDQAVPVQAALVAKKEIVIFPVLSLLSGAP